MHQRKPLVDVALVYGCSRGMVKHIDLLQSLMDQIVNQLADKVPSQNIRFALCPYYDYTKKADGTIENRQQIVCISSNFDSNMAWLKQVVQNQIHNVNWLSLHDTSELDWAEDVFTGIQQCAYQINWRESSYKIVYHIADAPCHGMDFHQEPKLDRFCDGDVYQRDVRKFLIRLRDEVKVARYQFVHVEGAQIFTQRMINKFRQLIGDDATRQNCWLKDDITILNTNPSGFIIKCAKVCTEILPSAQQTLPEIAAIVKDPRTSVLSTPQINNPQHVSQASSSMSLITTPAAVQQPVVNVLKQQQSGTVGTGNVLNNLSGKSWIKRQNAELYAYHVKTNCAVGFDQICEEYIRNGQGLQLRKVADVQFDFQVALFKQGKERTVHKVGSFRQVKYEDDPDMKHVRMRVENTPVQVIKMQRDGQNTFERVETYARKLAVSSVASQHFNRMLQEKQLAITGKTDYHMFLNFRDLYILKTTLAGKIQYLIMEPALHHAVNYSLPQNTPLLSSPTFPQQTEDAHIEKMGRDLAAAFSHFTYMQSAEQSVQFVVTDLKGMMIAQKQDAGVRRLACADPSIHIRDRRTLSRAVTQGDLEVQQFAQEHVCSDVCRHLQLPELRQCAPGVKRNSQHSITSPRATTESIASSYDGVLPMLPDLTTSLNACKPPASQQHTLNSVLLADPNQELIKKLNELWFAGLAPAMQ